MSAPPAVSVIVAVKNGSRTLQQCLDSIFAQAGVDVEAVVIDADSTDGTKAILQANASRLGYFFSEPDSGIYAAWNKALARARGAWLCFLSCDDTFSGELALRDLVRVAAKGSERVVYGKINLVTPRGIVAQTLGRPWQDARAQFLAGGMIPGPATLHHRSLFERHGHFDESYRLAGDYEFLLRELKQGAAVFVDRVAVNMRLRGASNRPDSIHLLVREIARARRQHGLRDTPLRLRLAFATSWIGAAIYRYFGERTFAALADAYRLVRGKPRAWTV